MILALALMGFASSTWQLALTRLGVLAFYRFDGLGFFASCAFRRAVKPTTAEPEVVSVER